MDEGSGVRAGTGMGEGSGRVLLWVRGQEVRGQGGY